MKGLLIAAATAALVIGAVYLLKENAEPSRPESGAVPGPAPVAPESSSPRDQLLHSTAQQAGVTPIRGVWGVVMERGFAKGVATVVALADGTASMYLSTGASAVGGGAYPPAHAAALKLCEQAADALGETTPTHEFPAPAKGRVRFYVLTLEGVRVAENDLFARPRPGDAGRDALAPLVAAGDAVLDGLKEATSKGLIR
jgi:hypothetical protein